MNTIAEGVYLEAKVGAVVSLPKYGTRLENRYVFDAAAREIHAMAARGLVKVVDERRALPQDSELITDIAFIKLR
jgi:hypothetical protein